MCPFNRVIRYLVPVFIILLWGGSPYAVSQTANSGRADKFLSEKLEEYFREVKEAELEYEKNVQGILKDCIARMDAEVVGYCKQGRLDIAELFYNVKLKAERGESLIEDAEYLPDGKEESVQIFIDALSRNDEDRKNKVNELNSTLQEACASFLIRARALPADRTLTQDEFNNLNAFLFQFPLPDGVCLPQSGERVGGLRCVLYRGAFNKLDDMSILGPIKRSFASHVELLWGVPDRDYGLVWDGLYYADVPGVYEFSINSDDGSRVSVGKEVIADNDFIHDPQLVKGTIYLSRGWVPIKIEYFQRDHTQSLSFQVRKPGDIDPADVPSHFFAGKLN